MPVLPPRSPNFLLVLLFTVTAFACCPSASAEIFPIIDVREGYLIGGVESGKWIEPSDAVASVKAQTKLPVYGVAGETGKVRVLKVDTEREPCPDRPVVKLDPRRVTRGAIAFAANWNPLPRKPQLLDGRQKEYVDLVCEFLREHGLGNPIVRISQVVRIDLDGDGQDEILISATHYKNGDKVPEESSSNTYSFVMLARVAAGKAKTELVAGEFYPEAKADAAPNKYEIVALLDLNGDGKIDIVVRSAYYEGDEVSVYELQPSGFNKALSVGCGL